MPIYEYKCPNGHLTEAFHGMDESGPSKCPECGASPMVRVLHPVAVHYKGSGFYSTDYGKSKKPAKETGGAAAGGDSSSPSPGESGGGGSSSGSDAGGSTHGGDGD